MSDPIAFDISLYIRPPQLNVASSVGLGTALVAAVPKKAPANVIKAAKRVRTCVLAMQAAWKKADGVVKPADPRPADHVMDNAWSTCEQRLDAYAHLPIERHPKAKRAAEIHATLFGDGMGWLTKPYLEEWGESDKRLKRIAEGKLEKELALLVGEEFVAEVKHAHARYGETIGVTKKKDGGAVEPAQLQEPLRAVASAVTFYATQVAAMVDPDEPSTATLARAALQPIDLLRAAQSGRRAVRGGGADVPPASPTSPVPEVP